MGILSWIVVGIVIGALAKWVMPGPLAGGMAVAVALSVAGAVLGGFIGTFNGGTLYEFEAESLLTAVAASLAVMLCYRSFAMRAVA